MALSSIVGKTKFDECPAIAINNQLAEQGLYIKSGAVSIIDASVIKAKQCQPHKRADGSTTQYPDAAWNVKIGSDGKSKSTYGYKAHIQLCRSGFITLIETFACFNNFRNVKR
jgi:hypothetical protein